MKHNMKATNILQLRNTEADGSFSEIVIWEVPTPLAGSIHSYKYRLAFVVDGVCVVRLDNEAGKGDHLHVEGIESAYAFTSIEQLLVDFDGYIERWKS